MTCARLHPHTAGHGVIHLPQPGEHRRLCRQVVDELAAFHPHRTLQLDCSGELAGRWDAPRIGQMLSNLMANAIQHSSPDTPVTVTVRGEPDAVSMQAHNRGPAMAEKARRTLFEPLMRPVVQEAEQREAGQVRLASQSALQTPQPIGRRRPSIASSSSAICRRLRVRPIPAQRLLPSHSRASIPMRRCRLA